MNVRTIVCFVIIFFPHVVLAQPTNESLVVEQAIKDYVSSASVVKKVNVEHIRIVGTFARATVYPMDTVTDPAMVFMKKVEGKWVGVFLGTAFEPNDCKELGLPRQICP